MIPRLTTRLKAFVLGEKSSDEISETFYRQSILNSASNQDMNVQFSVKKFLSDDFNFEYSSKIREDYSSFLHIVNTLTNETSQQNDAAKVLFNLVSKSQSKDLAYSSIKSYLGNLPEELFNQLYIRAQHLKEASAKVSSESSSRLNSLEYGPSISLFDFKSLLDDYFPESLEFISETSNIHPFNGFSNSNRICDTSADWLLNICEKFCTSNQSAFNSNQLAEEIILLILSLSNSISLEDTLQSKLFELVGDGGFEFMGEILQNLTNLKGITISKLRDTIKNRQDTLNLSNKVASVDINRNSQRVRNDLDSSLVSQGDLLRALGFTGEYLDQERSLGLQKGRAHGAADVKTTLSIYGGGLEYHEKRGLPAGTKTTSGPGYEEVHIPAPEKPSLQNTLDLVPIEELESWAQLAFPGTKYLNRIQSKVFDSVYNSSENMLICAPTGAGKTNIAMLAFLQLVKQNIDNGDLNKAGIKAIYIAPMKALAQEVVAKFSERLAPLGLVVKEYTGDMQLTKAEISESQLLVSTPEKYDVITRKGGDGSLGTIISLIIIDEVHLLADERGAVIETIVARTQRYVESSQKLVRLVGLSATLPNYKDVAMFLGVNQRTGLFYFGPEYRPVPLEQTFIGITEKQKAKRNDSMNRVAYNKVMSALERDKQIMIFVHSRKETNKTAEAIIELASRNSTLSMFENFNHEKYGLFKREVDKSRNRELQKLFYSGVGVHHAGMNRADRSLTETMFEQGVIRILCCTATLAWGVNLPAHTVIIKGTELYDPERGGFVDLSILDVFQIFGRAGRPQYDSTGHAIMITPHASLGKYLSLLGEQAPIESGFIKALADHMNAEIVNGTINNIKEAIQWLSYTFLYIRMCKNPMVYGISLEERMDDARLEMKRLTLVRTAAQKLDQCRMIRYDQRSGNLAVTDLGRIASHYYITHSTIENFNIALLPHLDEADALKVLCSSAEFKQLKLRPEEIPELDNLKSNVLLSVKGASDDDTTGKVSVLLQSYLNNQTINSFTLQSDTNYVSKNAGRIARALFEICMKRGWSTLTLHYLNLAKAIDKKMDIHQHPLRQFNFDLPSDVIKRLEDSNTSIDNLLEMNHKEIGELIHNQKLGGKVLSLTKRLPQVFVEASIQPLTRGILRISLKIRASFEWSDRFHGFAEPFWLWIEDGENEFIYHSESFNITKKQLNDVVDVECVIPVREPLPPQYYIRVISDRWIGCQSTIPLSFKHLLMPDRMPPHTDLLDMHPVPVTALREERFQSLYPFSHFNPVQSQVFHALYHSDVNALIGAPTGSGKTIIGEFALLRLFRTRPGAKAIYVAPLKALSRERLIDWQRKLGSKELGYRIEELTGDITPDLETLKRADLLIVTPEKWDSISRGWQRRGYVQLVELVIIDEIHLLGVDRGPVLEVIVSRMRFISSQTKNPIRFVGLSTALANPRDLADWLGINDIGVYNFRPSVRPIPMTIHIMGFPGKHYCPRMATMNKPCFAAIQEHSPKKPTLIFVSSRRQTRLTALDLISYCATEDNPKLFLNMPEEEIVAIAATLKDNSLRDTIVFGVGIHHAGLNNHDRTTVEQLFAASKIQVLVCTSTLAWGVNLPCHLVIVKGTEFYDGKTKRYVDMPVTDVLQMMGRAGRPQFDDTGVACVLVHEPKKNFYRKFLHEPFPVESSLHQQLHEHINAEIAAGTLSNIGDCVEYISWTYFFRRLIMNPSYYQLHNATPEGLSEYLSALIKSVLNDLADAGCIVLEGSKDNPFLLASTLGKITSYYYLNYRTSKMFQKSLKEVSSSLPENLSMNYGSNDESILSAISAFVKVMCDALEFSELPVRHNEDLLNSKLAKICPWPVEESLCGEANTKAYLLLQAHFFHISLPIADYVNDTKTVLDQVPRVINAMIDIAADLGLVVAVELLVRVSQMVIQGMAYDSTISSIRQLLPQDLSEPPKFSSISAKKGAVNNLKDLINLSPQEMSDSLSRIGLAASSITEFVSRAIDLPIFDVKFKISALDKNSCYSAAISIVRLKGKPGAPVYCPRYPKSKTISFWVVLSRGRELLVYKRINEVERSANLNIEFEMNESSINDVKVQLLNDSVMAID